MDAWVFLTKAKERICLYDRLNTDGLVTMLDSSVFSFRPRWAWNGHFGVFSDINLMFSIIFLTFPWSQRRIVMDQIPWLRLFS